MKGHLYCIGKVLYVLPWTEHTPNTLKCQMGLTEVQYEVYHIGRGLKKPLEKSMEAFREYPGLTSLFEADLYITGVFFVSVASPLSAVIKRVPRAGVKRFHVLKQALTSSLC